MKTLQVAIETLQVSVCLKTLQVHEDFTGALKTLQVPEDFTGGRGRLTRFWLIGRPCGGPLPHGVRTATGQARTARHSGSEAPRGTGIPHRAHAVAEYRAPSYSDRRIYPAAYISDSEYVGPPILGYRSAYYIARPA